MEDFPAAHSMDTTWFAIDRDGNLAVFESGEAGAVPEETLADQGFPHEDELRALPPTGVLMDPDGYGAAVQPGHEHLEINDFNSGYAALVFVGDVAAVRDLMPRLGAKELGATRGACLLVKLSDREAFTELHTRGACHRCVVTYRGIDEDDDEIARFGVFRYSHTCENWIAGPYAREAVPAKPVPLDQLPREIRDGAIRFDGRFAETVELQPVEHWPSQAWSASWLASDHKSVRPFADRLDEYREELAQMEDLGDQGLVFEAAPGGADAEEPDEDDEDADADGDASEAGGTDTAGTAGTGGDPPDAPRPGFFRRLFGRN